MSPLREVLSPFRAQKPKHNGPNGEDVESFELDHFVKLAVSGNPTILEILWSHLSSDGLAARGLPAMLRNNRERLIDTHAVWGAHQGYARSDLQWLFNFEFTNDERHNRIRGKRLSASIRTLWNGISILSTGTFNSYLTQERRDHMRQLRGGLTPAQARPFIREAQELLRNLNDLDESVNHRQADKQWAENFLYKAYQAMGAD